MILLKPRAQASDPDDAVSYLKTKVDKYAPAGYERTADITVTELTPQGGLRFVARTTLAKAE
jgi:hypothetical protein